MAEPATIIRRRPGPRAYSRNCLADFDTLVERALVAAGDGRDCDQLIREAALVAADLGTWCLDEEHQAARAKQLKRLLGGDGSHTLLELVGADLTIACHYSRNLGRADVAFNRARAMKSLLRVISCECTKRGLSESGRPLW